MASAGNEKYLEGFGQPAPGFDIMEQIGDLGAVEKAIGPETAGIMVEPIQAEGGIRVGSTEFLRGLRALCDKHGLLLVFDEVQCGMGRTGKMFVVRAGRHHARRDGDRQGASAGASRSARSWPPRKQPRAWCRARMARRSAAIRWRWPSPTPCSMR